MRLCCQKLLVACQIHITTVQVRIVGMGNRRLTAHTVTFINVSRVITYSEPGHVLKMLPQGTFGM
jgi:hypothetical protein